jgi:carbonic anhydrase/acetyltransferase-like protein (isoleucine patch superfamily)
MPVIPFGSDQPSVDPTAFIAPDAWVIGKVAVAARCSIFFNAVLRGDIERISIGEGTNLQEHVLVHTSHGMADAIIGKNVTVGHRAIIHGCSIGDRCLIGMGATILDNAEIEECCIIGAHTLIPKGVRIPARSLVVGTPGKVLRQITAEEEESLLASALGYQKLGEAYRGLALTR